MLKIINALLRWISPSEVEAVLTARAAKNREKLDWRNSIVDLLKLLNLNSNLSARKMLAQELGYTGKLDGSAEMNIWLHQAVMKKIAEHGSAI